MKKELSDEKIYGKIICNLSSIIEKSGISKNELCRVAHIDRTQLNHYCNNKAQLYDGLFLSKICHFYNVPLSEVIEYLPHEE